MDLYIHSPIHLHGAVTFLNTIIQEYAENTRAFIHLILNLLVLSNRQSGNLHYVTESAFWLEPFAAEDTSFAGWFLDTWLSLGMASW
jgi:hypothetical protein